MAMTKRKRDIINNAIEQGRDNPRAVLYSMIAFELIDKGISPDEYLQVLVK